MKIILKLKSKLVNWYCERIHHTAGVPPRAQDGELRVPCLVFGTMYMGQAVWYWNTHLHRWEDVDCDGIYTECKEIVNCWIYIRDLK